MAHLYTADELRTKAEMLQRLAEMLRDGRRVCLTCDTVVSADLPEWWQCPCDRADDAQTN